MCSMIFPSTKTRIRAIGVGLPWCLLVALSMVWVRSYLVWDGLTYYTHASATGEQTTVWIHSYVGGFGFSLAFTTHPPPHSAYNAGLTRISQHINAALRRYYLKRQSIWRSIYRCDLKDNIVHTADGGTERWMTLRFPYSLPVLLLMMILFGRAVSRAKSNMRRRTGCCQVCGYDLRGNRGRCPECGKGIALV